MEIENFIQINDNDFININHISMIGVDFFNNPEAKEWEDRFQKLLRAAINQYLTTHPDELESPDSDETIIQRMYLRFEKPIKERIGNEPPGQIKKHYIILNSGKKIRINEWLYNEIRCRLICINGADEDIVDDENYSNEYDDKYNISDEEFAINMGNSITQEDWAKMTEEEQSKYIINLSPEEQERWLRIMEN